MLIPSQLGWERAWKRQLATAFLFFCAALAAFMVTRRIALASVLERLADASWKGNAMFSLALFNQAAVADPWQIHFIERELHALFTAMPNLNLKDAKVAAKISLNTSDYQVKIHPNDPSSHDLRALALKAMWLTFNANTLKEAQREMNEASYLSPTSEAYVKDAAFVAADIGDSKSVLNRVKELKRLTELEHS